MKIEMVRGWTRMDADFLTQRAGRRVWKIGSRVVGWGGKDLRIVGGIAGCRVQDASYRLQATENVARGEG